MIIFSDKDGVLALTRKAFDSEIRAIYPVADHLPEQLPVYELLGHYGNDSEITAAWFRKLTGRDQSFDFKTYLNEYCETLKKVGIWRKFPYNGAILYMLDRIRRGMTKQGKEFRFNVITASGTNPEDRRLVGADTRLWLDQCGMTDAHLIHETVKEKYLDCDIWIEDMPKYIIRILKAGFKGRVFLVDHTYNKDETLKYQLTASQFSRIRRIYPSLEIYRSHAPDPIDLTLSLEEKTPHVKALAKKVRTILQKLAQKGLDVVKDPNHMEEYTGKNFALAFRSDLVDQLVSLLGSDAAAAIISRNMQKIMEVTRCGSNHLLEEYFINERFTAFQRGWPLYIHFEFNNNQYLYNSDSIHWFRWFEKKSRNAGQVKISQNSNKVSIEVKKYKNSFLKNTIGTAFVLDEIPQEFSRILPFNDGQFSLELKNEIFSFAYQGPRAKELFVR
jgi:hypothetical protein